ncbi:MAG: hypothetical protein U1F16_07240 [Turneriella sp.]
MDMKNKFLIWRILVQCPCHEAFTGQYHMFSGLPRSKTNDTSCQSDATQANLRKKRWCAVTVLLRSVVTGVSLGHRY